jgi:deoxyadenosine/deoxycytidine kinase
MVIYLKAEPDLLLQRIAKRNRSFERNMKAAYLRQLSQAYDDYFTSYTGRVHTIDAAKFDFVNKPNDRDDLINEIMQFAQAA